jgi:predicted transcriptional regulator
MVKRKRRSFAEVLRSILDAAQGGEKKTRIMFRSNLNPLALERYLEFCELNGLIIKNVAGYVTSSKGMKLLNYLNQANAAELSLQKVESDIQHLFSEA